MIDARVRKRLASGFELDVHWKTESRSAVLLGPAGAGKTLLLESLCGFARPDEGRVLVNGALVFDGAARIDFAPGMRRLAYVPSRPSLFPHLTLRENLAFGLSFGGRLERRRKVDVMLDDSGLASKADETPASLTAGERLRASVARALLCSPGVLLIDEPEKGLDAALREEMRAAIDVAAEGRGVQVIAAGRDPDDWLGITHEVAVLSDGVLLRNGDPDEVLDDPVSAGVAQLLGRHAVLETEILAMDPARKLCRLRCAPAGEPAFELLGPYFPGHLKGSRVHVAVRIDRVIAEPRGGEGIPRVVQRIIEGPRTVRLLFDGGIIAETARRDWEPHRHNRNWTVTVPPEAVTLLK